MNKHVSKLLQPGVFWYCLILLAFAVAAALLDQYYLATGELVVTVIAMVVSRLLFIRRRNALMQYVQSATDAEGISVHAGSPFPMAVIRLPEGEIIWGNEGFYAITGLSDGCRYQTLESVVPGFTTGWLREGRNELPGDQLIGTRRYRIYGNYVRSEDDATTVRLATIFFADMTEMFNVRDEFLRTRPITAVILIDNYDELMSNRLTDKKKFVDALLVFFGMTLRDGDDEKLAQEKFLDGAPLDARAEYIQKTFDESSVQVLADALVREMHKMTMTVDMSDEQFAGNSSGQALKLKLLTMNLLAKNKMRRMEKGLKERFSLYNHWLVTHGDMAPVGVNDIDVVFTLSMPINESEIVQMVTSLQGIVDDRTLLSQLWFVRDPAEAAENIRRQKQANAAIYGVPSQADETEAEEDTKKVLKQDE